ncbi:MAG TPA: hypothetical protein VGS08_04795 [Candidatus Saccharimonadales bacterium]|nr:hypothetical protein [Candidatus Saccharimonadales bacterium]
MTKYLSRTLGATEPDFSQTIAELERASGHPSADIRLSSELRQRIRTKVAALGLDPNDTTGEELYGALCERLRHDDELVKAALHLGDQASPVDVSQAICNFLEGRNTTKVFVLKASVARRLLKKHPPKLAMKQLGYRSLDSMLKREAPALIYAAAVIAESTHWHDRFRTSYSALHPSDFELRAMDLHCPKTVRWQTCAKTYSRTARQNILCFRELGSIVLLPTDEQVDGFAIVTLLFALESMNDIRAHSSFVKLNQVKPDFGHIIQLSSHSDPRIVAKLADQPLSWSMVQHYYGQHPDHRTTAFEPHVQAEDLQWHNAEDALADLEPSLAFWRDTQCLGLLDGDAPVSMNVLDVALNYCNHLPFPQRVVRFLRSNVWHELMNNYLDQNNLEMALQDQLSAGLISEPAAIES